MCWYLYIEIWGAKMTDKPIRKKVTYLRAPTDADGLYELNRIIGEEIHEYAKELERARLEDIDAVMAAHELHRKTIRDMVKIEN